MHDRPVELVQVAQFLQGVRDRGVGQLGLGHAHQGTGATPRCAMAQRAMRARRLRRTL